MTFLITFLEGVITFISPCLLPLLPVYIAYFAGGVQQNTPAAPASSKGAGIAIAAGDAASAGTADVASNTTPDRDNNANKHAGVLPAQSTLGHTVISALGFVAGFTLLFTAMGAFAATIGGFFQQNQTVLNVVCGIIVIFFGLHFMGVWNFPALQKTLRPNMDRPPRGFFTSLLFGMVFAIGWTPCVGAFLGSALALAASTGSTLQGIALLLCYSLGLGIPFILTAILIDQLEGALSWVKRHYRVVNTVCGALLVVVGILMASGQMGKWLSLLAG